MKVAPVLLALTVGFDGAPVIRPAIAGPDSNVEQHSEGPCSPVVGTNQGTITIECSGLSKEVSDQIIQILNKILASQVDQKEILKQLGELGKSYEVLAARSIDAQRGVISLYDFNGAKRVQTAGRTSLTVGPETAVFQNMADLEKKQQWADLIALAEKQISETPSWLTPYLFAAHGYIALGDKFRALERLEYVAAHAGNDPSYQIAGQWIAKLKAQQ